MFEQATRLKLRFNHKGLCSVEDLWDLSLKSLDIIYKELKKQSKEQKEESLLGIKDQNDKILDIKIEIIKYIVEVKLMEQKQRQLASQKQKLLAIIAEKEDKKLYDMDIEDLKKLAQEL